MGAHLFRVKKGCPARRSRMERGGWEFDFRDSWKNEVAAYEVDQLMGLGLVPPTVEREVQGHRGPLPIWVQGVMTEKDRQERGLEPTGPRAVIRWANQIHCTRLLHQLTYNEERLGLWLGKMQVEVLLHRRDRILEIVLFGPPPVTRAAPPTGSGGNAD